MGLNRGDLIQQVLDGRANREVADDYPLVVIAGNAAAGQDRSPAAGVDLSRDT